MKLLLWKMNFEVHFCQGCVFVIYILHFIKFVFSYFLFVTFCLLLFVCYFSFIFHLTFISAIFLHVWLIMYVTLELDSLAHLSHSTLNAPGHSFHADDIVMPSRAACFCPQASFLKDFHDFSIFKGVFFIWAFLHERMLTHEFWWWGNEGLLISSSRSSGRRRRKWSGGSSNSSSNSSRSFVVDRGVVEDRCGEFIEFKESIHYYYMIVVVFVLCVWSVDLVCRSGL